MKFYNVFSGFLTGETAIAFKKNSGNKVFNSLHSYWYLKDLPDEKIKEGFEMTKGEIMIDSGAFTAWTKDIEIDVEAYINWINKWDKYITLFGQIDVIPPKNSDYKTVDECCIKTWENYLYMRDRISSPEKLLYTFHFGEDYKWLLQALEYRNIQSEPIKYLALGGLVGKSSKQKISFLNDCFYIIEHSSNSNIKVHGFGVSSEKLWKKYPFESCDSFRPGITTNYQSEKTSMYTMENYERIFKLRGWTKQSSINEVKIIDNNMSKINKTDEKVKLLIKNIEYWNDLADSISKN